MSAYTHTHIVRFGMYYIFIDFIFLELFCAHSKNEGNVEISHVPPHPPDETFVTTDKPESTCHNHPKTHVYTGVFSWCCTLCGF